MSVFNTAHVSKDNLSQEGMLLPTREELAFRAMDTIEFWMESGRSQLLSSEQALEIAMWALKISGHKYLMHQVMAELVELPEEAIQPL